MIPVGGTCPWNTFLCVLPSGLYMYQYGAYEPSCSHTSLHVPTSKVHKALAMAVDDLLTTTSSSPAAGAPSSPSAAVLRDHDKPVDGNAPPVSDPLHHGAAAAAAADYGRRLRLEFELIGWV